MKVEASCITTARASKIICIKNCITISCRSISTMASYSEHWLWRQELSAASQLHTVHMAEIPSAIQSSLPIEKKTRGHCSIVCDEPWSRTDIVIYHSTLKCPLVKKWRKVWSARSTWFSENLLSTAVLIASPASIFKQSWFPRPMYSL